MEVILSDIDGTVLDVDARIARSLEEIGVDPGSHPSQTADLLQRPLKSRFFDVFLTEKHAGLDQPIPEIIAFVADLQKQSGLELVFLSGRPETMKRATHAAIEATGLVFREILLRPRSQRMRRTTEFKVDAVVKRGYEPSIILDDDVGILAAFSTKFASAKLYHVKGPQATPWSD
jgi:hypothetical protein